MDKISILYARKRELERTLADVLQLIFAYEEFERKFEAILGEQAQDVVKPMAMPLQGEAKTEIPTTRARSGDVTAFEAAVLTILQKANGPMDRSALLQSLEAIDISVGGQEPLNTLGARVFRMEAVKTRRGVGYYLKVRESEFFPTEGVMPKPNSNFESDLDDLLG